jgi:hypothetical protein
MGVEFVDPRIFSKVALLWHHEGAQYSTAMNRSIKMPAWRWFATNFLLCLAAVAVPLQGVGAPSDEPSNAAVPELIQRMAGNWTVEEWMWTGTGTEPIALPPAVAQRHLIGNEFLEEVMTATPASTQPFTRIAYFDYNAVAQQYEYFSLDTRAAQMMNERSVGAAREGHDPAGLVLYGGIFIAPQWGPAKNAAFRYRIVVGGVAKDRQTVELYLTPVSADSPHEFLAFKYLYTRRR